MQVMHFSAPYLTLAPHTDEWPFHSNMGGVVCAMRLA